MPDNDICAHAHLWRPGQPCAHVNLWNPTWAIHCEECGAVLPADYEPNIICDVNSDEYLETENP